MPETDRAVSDVLGFVFVFALIVTSIGVVYVGGLDSLESARDAERVTNAERAFDVLADNIGDTVQEDAPARATEIKLAEAELALTNHSRISVTITNASGDTSGPHVAEIRPVVYSAKRSVVVYEAGAVIRADEHGGAVMKREPQMVFTQGWTVIPYVKTRSRTQQGVGGTQTVLVRTDRKGADVLAARTQADDPPYDITLEFRTTPKRAPAWERYFEEQIDWTNAGTDPDPCSVTGNTVTCEFQTMRVYVTVTKIDVEIE